LSVTKALGVDVRLAAATSARRTRIGMNAAPAVPKPTAVAGHA